MPKTKPKRDRAHKLCATCGLPFSWRKKWARDWEEVRYCSERCRRTKGRVKGSGAVG